MKNHIPLVVLDLRGNINESLSKIIDGNLISHSSNRAKKTAKLETEMAILFRRSWHTLKKIKKNKKFTKTNSILIKRSIGISQTVNIIEKTSKENINKEKLIKLGK
ncbi:MAG: hypothetical protein CBE11_03780 [Rickettsiales bacterium TMED251]|nr:MAG: hypothetical protein CBE11_03780 [Rickettsiales bacterium TMED251]|tara:strand:- start:11085 stop:11402 length:318 start_codon:yes stop_codon:yes gene_type:complete